MKIVSYGGGTNSTALLIELVKRNIPVSLILFADTGGEKPHTYEYVEMFSDWLEHEGWPPIKTVMASGKTLEQDCLDRKALPSVAYGFKTCSQRHKIAPQDKFMNNYQAAKDVWNLGEKITKIIGYDADEPQRAKDYEDKKYDFWYPLIEWDMGRDECVESIKSVGLPLPGKSACFFCPSSRPHEIKQLKIQYPDLAERAIAMEKNAIPGPYYDDWEEIEYLKGKPVVEYETVTRITDEDREEMIWLINNTEDDQFDFSEGVYVCSTTFIIVDGDEIELDKLSEIDGYEKRKIAVKKKRPVVGLGRNWAWADLLATDDMFADDYENHIEISCGCYDG